MPPRVLILTASVGEGHDRPARWLASQLRDERPGVEVAIEDCLPAMGRFIRLMSESAPRVIFYRLRWLWDLGFWFFTRPAASRELSQRITTRLGTPGLLRLIERHDPDVIVSVYPIVTEVLGRLRRSGCLRCPSVAAITDLAAMHYWASRGIDVHLVTHPESIAEVRTIVGAAGSVHCVHGFSDPAFRSPLSESQARASLGLPASGKIVVVSGGGWGVGDVESAVEQALAVPAVTKVVCLCGRNEDLRSGLGTRFGSEPRVRVEGFTEAMPAWLAAADALVHSTGGLTVLEALMRGCPPISYGWGRGHVRTNNAAFRRFGLADVAESRSELRAAIVRALDRGRLAPNAFPDLPSAASFVLAAADAR
jgi:UDP-N-acetylglucosamine:LPS N-acetylglucosamine transferase